MSKKYKQKISLINSKDMEDIYKVKNFKFKFDYMVIGFVFYEEIDKIAPTSSKYP